MGKNWVDIESEYLGIINNPNHSKKKKQKLAKEFVDKAWF